ncbi:MAG: hypothetical protein ACMUJM_19055 [bacterium]
MTSVRAEVGISGFADMTFVLSDGAAENESQIENKFSTIAELNVITKIDNQLSARLDLDLNTGGQGDSGQLEQAYFIWTSSKDIQFKGGVFNNHLGWEAEDAPSMYQITHGQLYDIWNIQTSLRGNNVTGIAISGYVDKARLMGAFLNDLQDTNEENSIEFVVNIYPNQFLDIEAGVVTQETGAETIIDGSVTYKKGQITAGVELMQCSKVIDFAQSATLNYEFNKDMNGTVRFDSVNYEDEQIEETTSLTFAIGYRFHKNLSVNGEIRINNDDNNADNDGNIIRAEVVATF